MTWNDRVVHTARSFQVMVWVPPPAALTGAEPRTGSQPRAPGLQHGDGASEASPSDHDGMCERARQQEIQRAPLLHGHADPGAIHIRQCGEGRPARDEVSPIPLPDAAR